MKTCETCGLVHDGAACPVCKWMKVGKRAVKKVSHKSCRTPRSKIKNALRLLSLRCRERQEASKRADYSCATCGAKQSKARGREVAIEVHHIDPVAEGDWMNKIIDLIQEHLLPPPEKWMVLCATCHAAEHAEHAQSAVDGGGADVLSCAAKTTKETPNA